MVNLLHDARTTGISLAALLSLGMGGQQTRCPARAARAAHPQPATASVHAPAPAPNMATSWMDYIDFRRGSGDALTNLGGPALAARPRHLAPGT